MHKIRRMMVVSMLTLSSIAVSYPAISVNAEENSIESVDSHDMIKVDFEVLLSLGGQDAIPQDQISFEIIQYPQPNSQENGEKVYEYQSGTPQKDIYLAPGYYKFRLYDGQQFVREGITLQPDKVEQTAPEVNMEDPESTEGLMTLDNAGQIIDWGNGTFVYDVLFELEASDYLYNGTTGEYESQLVFTLSDGQVPDDDESEVGLNPVTVQLIDENNQPLNIPGVDIVIGDTQATTDESGVTSYELAPGSYQIRVMDMEGYEFAVPMAVEVVEGQAASYQVQAVPTQTAPVQSVITLELIDENQQSVAMPNIEIAVGDMTVVTDETGRATLEMFPGTYEVRVTEVDGYEFAVPMAIEVVEGQPAEFQVQVVPNQEMGMLNVSVLDVNEVPIANATVTIDDATYTTDASGKIVVESIPTDTEVSVSLDTLPENYRLVDETMRHQVVVVNSDEAATVQYAVEEVPQSGEVALTILNDENAPVENVTVRIAEQEATTDSDGMARFEAITPGEYPIQVIVPDGYQPVEGTAIAVQSGQIAEKSIVLSSETLYSELTFKIVDQDQQPVMPASILFNDIEYPTNAQGEVILLDVEVGPTHNYQLNTLPENYRGTASGTVKLEGTENEPVVIEVERQIAKSQLIIQLVDQFDQPVPGMAIELNESSRQTTDGEGRVRFTNLDPGDYQYALVDLPDEYEDEQGPQSIHLVEGSEEQRTIRVQRPVEAGHVAFTVVDQDGQPVSNVGITFNNQTLSTNENGLVELDSVAPGTYEYSITQYPEGYQGEVSGELTLSEGQSEAVTLEIQRELKPGHVLITVQDASNQPVSGVVLTLNEVQQTTNQEGVAQFNELAPGSYAIAVSEIPQGYAYQGSEVTVEVQEDQTTEQQVQLELVPEVGNVEFLFTDGNQPVANVEVTFDGMVKHSDAEGIVRYDDLLVGNYIYQITQLPEGYQLGQLQGNIDIIEDTTEQISLTLERIVESSQSESSDQGSVSESSHESSMEESEESFDDDEAALATREFVDSTTGITIYLHPDDARNVVRLSTKKLNQVPALNDFDADAYELTLLDRNNNSVPLNHVARVSIPTRPVNSQLRLMRVQGDAISNLSFELRNQKMHFRTQQLGTFAIIYRDAESISQEESQSREVSIESSVEERDLPGTGETNNILVIILGVLALGAGGLLLFTRRKK